MESAILEYIRSGDRRALPVQNNECGGISLPDDWFTSSPVPNVNDKFELYAMPAATSALLQDDKVDLKAWLIEEAQRSWEEQKREGYSVGPARVLRDPYSAKPYVLFYVTATSFRVEQ